MKSVIRLLTVLSVCMFALAAVPAQAGQALSEEFYRKSGLEKQMEQFPALIQAGFDQARNQQPEAERIPAEVAAVMRELIAEFYRPARIKGAVLKEIDKGASPDELRFFLSWLDTPLGRKCTALEEAAATPAAQAALEAYGAGLQSAPPSPHRVELMGRMDSATKGTETAVEMSLNMQLALTTAMVLSAQPDMSRETFSMLAREIAKAKPQVEAAMKPALLLSYLYTYDSLPEAELEEYVRFLSTETAGNLYAVVNEAIQKVLNDASFEFGTALAERLKNKEKLPSRT